MKAHYVIPFAAVLSLSLAVGCQRRESDRTDSTRTTSANPPPEATGGMEPSENVQKAPSRAPLSSEDRDFVLDAAKGGMAEVAFGNMAEQKAESPDVKAFGNRMVTDHTKANDELKKLAADKNVTLPSDMGKENTHVSDKLSKLNGAQFDREYAKDMVKDHESDVKEFEKAAKNAKDPDVKAFAQRTLPVLQDHLKMAKEMAPKVGAKH